MPMSDDPSSQRYMASDCALLPLNVTLPPCNFGSGQFVAKQEQ